MHIYCNVFNQTVHLKYGLTIKQIIARSKPDIHTYKELHIISMLKLWKEKKKSLTIATEHGVGPVNSLVRRGLCETIIFLFLKEVTNINI